MSFRVKRPIKTLRNKPSTLRKIRLEQHNFARSRKPLLGGLSSVLTITAIIGTVLTLLGFGAALKLETFGLDAADAYSSPFDFLVLSSQVLVQVFNVLSKISINPAPHHVWYFVVAPTCAFVTLLIYRLLRKRTRRAMYGYAINNLPRVKQFTCAMWAKPWVELPLVTLAGWLFWGSLARLLFIFLLGLIILISIPTLIGYRAAESYLNQYVINASQCTPLYSQAQRQVLRKLPAQNKQQNSESPTTATCLSVTKDGKELGRGRKITRNNDAVFLFKPDTGEVFSVPIKDAIVKQITEL